MILFEFDFSGTSWLVGQGIKAKNLDLVLSVIANGMIRHGVDENGYVDIPFEAFKRVYSGYKGYLDFLQSMGKITKSPYKKGKKCLGYRFSEDFKRELVISNIILDYKTKVGSVLKVANRSKMNVQKSTEQHYIDSDLFEHLLYDFKSCTIDFDLSRMQIEKTKDEWNRFIDIKKWFMNNVNLYRWKKGYLNFGFESNRLYSNFTYLSSHVRKNNIRLSGEKLVEFDIHNSFGIL